MKIMKTKEYIQANEDLSLFFYAYNGHTQREKQEVK